MTFQKTKIWIVAVFILSVVPILAMSIETGRDIKFPQNYDAKRAQAIRKVIQDDRFKFVGGIISLWAPDIDTRLSFEGDARSLNEFFAALKTVNGVDLRVVLYHGRNDELRRDSPWQFDFSEARSDQLTVYVNQTAATLDFKKVKFPPEFKISHHPPETGPRG